MPTTLGEPFEVTWDGAPEQMLEQDVPLWHLFRKKYGSQFSHFFYNVRVGGPDLKNVKADEKLLKMWYDVTAKRIDAIGEKNQEIWIIEVASIPGIRAIGQILSYRFLWNLDIKIKKLVKDVLLCYRIDNDLEMVLKHYGVMVLKIPQP